MKIEVDLSDVFCDENGISEESLQECIKRQVVDNLSARIGAGISKQIDAEVAKVITETLKATAETMLPELAKDMIDAEYRVVSTYGGVSKDTTTFRAELLKEINKQIVYKKKTHRSDESIFTRCIDEVVAENIKTFKAEFNALVTDKFRDEALAHAVNSLKKKLGLE